MDVSHLLDELNEAQRQAVTVADRHVLVLAGAGSGKTRVLVHRLAWLIQVEHVSPLGVLAVTFTNKAAGGYPGRYAKGRTIHGLDSDFPEHVKVFHAGTALADGAVVTSGGRVLCVCALGSSVTEAQAEAYLACRQIHWDGAYLRNDIGYRAIQREMKL